MRLTTTILRYTAGICLAVGLALPNPVHAYPIVWTLQNASFADDTTLTGSFTYDNSTGTLTNVNIAWSGGLSFTHVGNTGYLGNQSFQALTTNATVGTASAYGSYYLYLDFAAPMDGALSTLSIASYYDGFIECGNIYCTNVIAGTGHTLQYSATTGYGDISAPEPVTLTLFGTGLIGLAVVRRRRR